MAYQGGLWQGSLEGRATLTEEVGANLTVRAGQGVGGRFGLTFRPLPLPLSLQAGLGYQGGVTADGGFRVRLDGLEVGGGLAYQPQGTSATLYVAYRERDFGVRGGLSLTPTGRTLVLAGEGRLEDLEGASGSVTTWRGGFLKPKGLSSTAFPMGWAWAFPGSTARGSSLGRPSGWWSSRGV